jgi:hypothetical protein
VEAEAAREEREAHDRTAVALRSEETDPKVDMAGCLGMVGIAVKETNRCGD